VIFLRYGYSVAGASVAVILGPGLEAYLRRGLLLSKESWLIFLSRPWTVTILVVAIAFLIYATVGTIMLARGAAAVRRKGLEARRASLSTSKG